MSSTDNPAIDKLLTEAKLAAADPKPTMLEIRQAIADQAWHLEGTQRALAILGAPGAPVPSVMRQVAILDAGVRFIDACLNQPLEVAKRLQKQGRPK